MAEPLGERKKYGLETALSLRLSDSGHVPLACAPRRAYLSSLIISRLPKQKLPVRLDRQFFYLCRRNLQQIAPGHGGGIKGAVILGEEVGHVLDLFPQDIVAAIH